MKIGRNVVDKIIVNVEEYWIQERKPGKVCDCLIVCCFLEKRKIALVELKGTSPDASTIVSKIQNVCNSIEELLDSHILHNGSGFDFYPILLSKNISPNEMKMLLASRIKFQRAQVDVIRENCNVSLEYIFQKYS
jgi:hypothetical protein